MSFHVPEQFRLTEHKERSLREKWGNNGAFRIPSTVRTRLALMIVASDGEGWEHVSVSTVVRTPTWEEMCFVKNLFWDEEDEVIQFHPKRSEYVNCHPHCLHMWKPVGKEILMPPTYLIGLKGDRLETIQSQERFMAKGTVEART